VADRHPGGIAGTHLQAVHPTNLDHGGAAARDGVDRRCLADRYAAHPMPTLACTGMLASAVTALTKVMARARFQGVERRVLVLTTGPKMCARLLDYFQLLMGPHAGQALTRRR